MSLREWRFGSKRARAFGEAGPLVVVHMDLGEARRLSERLPEMTILSIDGVDWSRDLTPWPARSPFRGQPDFSGGADVHLEELSARILPEAEAALGAKERWIAGYSLAGLFALWASLRTNLFRRTASVSGSLWYPEFAQHAEQMENAPRKVYLSVGDREKLSRNRAFQTIESDNLRMAQWLSARGAETLFETVPGGHFQDPLGRMERALRWLAREEKEAMP